MSTRPNFLVLVTDDQGPWAMSRTCPELVTPVLDDLVSRSTSFDNFYCASPVCSPARASLLTGRMPSAHGVHDWLVGERHPDALEDVYLGGLVTLPEVLDQAGYTCAMSGKWHVGTSRHPAPGFDRWYAHRLGGGPYYGAPVWTSQGEPASEERYFTYAVAEEACRFIDEIAARATPRYPGRLEAGSSRPGPDGPAPGAGRPEPGESPSAASTASPGQDGVGRDADGSAPFYLQVNFTAPHTPWIDNHPQDLYDLYRDCDFPSVPREERHPWSEPRRDFDDAFADPVRHLQGYAASLSGVDRALGMLLERLRLHGLDDNTVIVYMADNGFSCGHHGIWGKGNGTYPLNFWQNSVTVPCVVHRPGQSRAHRVDEHVSACGFLETICELAGVRAPEDPLRAAGSFAGLLDGDRPAEDRPVVVFDEYGGGRMIRQGDHKYVERHDGPTELYDLAEDPQERHNLAENAEKASLASDLRTCLRDWFAAHENPVDSAWTRGVRGIGQVHPPRKGYDDERTYIQLPISLDGSPRP